MINRASELVSVGIAARGYVVRAASTTFWNAFGSVMARSERILRSSFTLALASPAIRREYDRPRARAAALMRMIHRPRKSPFFLRRWNSAKRHLRWTASTTAFQSLD